MLTCATLYDVRFGMHVKGAIVAWREASDDATATESVLSRGWDEYTTRDGPPLPASTRSKSVVFQSDFARAGALARNQFGFAQTAYMRVRVRSLSTQ